MRLIDADALLNLPFEKMIHTDYGDTCVPIEEIEMAPTISLSLNEDRQSGHWILEEEDCDNRGNNFYQCSKCFYHDTHSSDAIVPYCWHCGAYMLSEESGQEVSNES